MCICLGMSRKYCFLGVGLCLGQEFLHGSWQVRDGCGSMSMEKKVLEETKAQHINPEHLLVEWKQMRKWNCDV